MSSDTRFVYTVSCEIDEPGARRRWLDWLEGEHVADVCDAGALEGWIVCGVDRPERIEVHYVFADRQAFEKYEREQAPRLRALGLERPEASLVRFTRRTGTRRPAIGPRAR